MTDKIVVSRPGWNCVKCDKSREVATTRLFVPSHVRLDVGVPRGPYCGVAVVTGKTITFCEDCGSRGFGHLYLLGVDYSKCPECGSKMITIDESEKHLYPYIKGTIFETPLFEFMEKRKRMIKISLRGGRGD